MDETLLQIVKELEKEYGFVDVPDGSYYVSIDGAQSKEIETKDGTPMYRIAVRVEEGNFKNRVLSELLSWFGPSEAGTHAARARVTQLIRLIAAKATDDVQEKVRDAYIGLKSARTPGDATPFIAKIVQAANGLKAWVVQKTKNDFSHLQFTQYDKATKSWVPFTGVTEAQRDAVDV